MDIKFLTELVAEPVSITEAKAWMKVSFNSDDSLIGGLVGSARGILERYTGLSFGIRDIELIVTPYDWFELPYGPVIAVESVERVGEMGDLTAVTDYVVLQNRIKLPEGMYKIVYKAGYTSLPEDLKADIKRLAAWMYQNRGIQFESGDEIKGYPDWAALAANRYMRVIV